MKSYHLSRRVQIKQCLNLQALIIHCKQNGGRLFTCLNYDRGLASLLCLPLSLCLHSSLSALMFHFSSLTFKACFSLSNASHDTVLTYPEDLVSTKVFLLTETGTIWRLSTQCLVHHFHEENLKQLHTILEENRGKENTLVLGYYGWMPGCCYVVLWVVLAHCSMVVYWPNQNIPC